MSRTPEPVPPHPTMLPAPVGGDAVAVAVVGAPALESTRIVTVLLGALSAFGPLSTDMYLPGLPALTRSMHASASSGQLTLTGSMAGMAIGQAVVGPASDALGRRVPLLAALIGYLVASIACAFAPSISVLVVLRLVQGVSGGAGVVIARAIVRDVFADRRAARMYGLLAAIMGVAPIFAPLVGAELLALTSWRGVFIVLGAIGVVLLVVTAWVLPETLPVGSRHGGGLGATRRVFGRLLRDRGYVPYLGSFTLVCSAMFAYIAGAAFVLENVYGISPQLFSVVFAANSAALVLTSWSGGRLVGRGRFDPPLLLRAGLIVATVSGIGALAVVLWWPSLPALLLCLLGLLAAMGLIFPNGTASAMNSQREGLGSAAALLGLGQFGMGAAVAPLVGVSGSHSALPMAIVICAGAVSALAVNLAFAPRGRSAAH